MGIIEILTNPRSSRSADTHSEALKLLRRQGQRVGALITNLLDYSRIEVKGSEVELEDVDVAAAVEQASRAAPPPDGVTIDGEVPAGLIIRADPVRLEQVLVNLLTNAYRYGGPRISISAAAAGGDVILSVNDDGPGIEPGLAVSLFDPFTRGSQTHSIIGSGLGLAIVKRLVESFEGEIWCENLTPNGTSFKIRWHAVG
jgi:signal transduction histidine kinase